MRQVARWSWAAMLAIALGGGLCAPALAQVYTGPGAPPLRMEAVPPPPGPNYVWRPGHWRWTGNHYTWVRGQYVKVAARNRQWVAGHWRQGPHGKHWVEGHWR